MLLVFFLPILPAPCRFSQKPDLTPQLTPRLALCARSPFPFPQARPLRANFPTCTEFLNLSRRLRALSRHCRLLLFRTPSRVSTAGNYGSRVVVVTRRRRTRKPAVRLRSKLGAWPAPEDCFLGFTLLGLTEVRRLSCYRASSSPLLFAGSSRECIAQFPIEACFFRESLVRPPT